ncbi:MAG: pilus assembly protein [Pseudodonghicola sp.]|nr:pilus assembly protein [Pseudodonghicola sp.]
MRRKLPSMLRRFLGDTHGSVSVEFVLVMPFLFWAFMATFVYFDGFRQSAQNLKAAYAIGDMISRETESINDTYVDSMEEVLQLMARSSGTVKLRVTVVRWDEDDDRYYVVWSENRGYDKPRSNSDMEDIEARLPVMPDGERVILIETQSTYEPTFAVGVGDRDLDNFIFTRPRFVNQLKWSNS